MFRFWKSDEAESKPVVGDEQAPASASALLDESEQDDGAFSLAPVPYSYSYSPGAQTTEAIESAAPTPTIPRSSASSPVTGPVATATTPPLVAARPLATSASASTPTKSWFQDGLNGISKMVRAKVSADKYRYQQGAFDLDLTYITDRIIAMSYPAEGVESTYRNYILDVATLLKTRHGGHFMIYNLQERDYDYEKFDHMVQRFAFPDHHGPPLAHLMKIVKSMDSWLAVDPKNVAAVHCKAGKGRTGTIIAAFFVFTGMFDAAEHALNYFAAKRSANNWGVTGPSQRRSVEDFTRIVQGYRPSSEPVLLTEIVMEGVPRFDWDGCTPFWEIYDYTENKWELIATNRPKPPGSPKTPAAPGPPPSTANTSSTASLSDPPPLRSFVTRDQHCHLPIGRVIRGDIMIHIRHYAVGYFSGPTDTLMARFSFHTGFLPQHEFVLLQEELDDAQGDARFPINFRLRCLFAPAPPDHQPTPELRALLQYEACLWELKPTFPRETRGAVCFFLDPPPPPSDQPDATDPSSPLLLPELYPPAPPPPLLPSLSPLDLLASSASSSTDTDQPPPDLLTPTNALDSSSPLPLLSDTFLLPPSQSSSSSPSPTCTATLDVPPDFEVQSPHPLDPQFLLTPSVERDDDDNNNNKEETASPPPASYLEPTPYCLAQIREAQNAVFGDAGDRTVEMGGYLKKQGDFTGPINDKGWKRRWFVLKEDCLSYFSSPRSQKALGSISLLLIQDVVPQPGYHDCRFDIVTQTRTYYFIADNPTSRSSWMRAILQSQANLVQRTSDSAARAAAAQQPPPLFDAATAPATADEPTPLIAIPSHYRTRRSVETDRARSPHSPIETRRSMSSLPNSAAASPPLDRRTRATVAAPAEPPRPIQGHLLVDFMKIECLAAACHLPRTIQLSVRLHSEVKQTPLITLPSKVETSFVLSSLSGAPYCIPVTDTDDTAEVTFHGIHRFRTNTVLATGLLRLSTFVHSDRAIMSLPLLDRPDATDVKLLLTVSLQFVPLINLVDEPHPPPPPASIEDDGVQSRRKECIRALLSEDVAATPSQSLFDDDAKLDVSLKSRSFDFDELFGAADVNIADTRPPTSSNAPSAAPTLDSSASMDEWQLV